MKKFKVRPMCQRGRKYGLWLAVIASLATLFICLYPSPSMPPITNADKWSHLVGFTGLALLWGWIQPKHWGRVLLGLILFGGLIEVLQGWSGYRSAEWADWLVDILGAVLGLGVLNMAHPVWRKACPEQA